MGGSVSAKSTGIGLIIAADEPALFFSSRLAAERYLEAIDVEQSVYSAAYDPDGRPYQVATERGRVVLSPELDQPCDPEALKVLIHLFLRQLMSPRATRMS